MKGVSFLGLLGIAFIILKLCKVIDWSWWWVTAPIWIPFAIGCILLPFYFKAKKKEIDEKYSRPTNSKWQDRLDQMQQAKQKSNHP